jgi:hypothetical protein
MKTIDVRNTHLATTPPRLIRRFNFAVVIAAFCLFPNGQGSTSNLSPHQIAVAQDATGQNPELGTAAETRVAEGEYKVLTENGIGPFAPAVYGFSETWTLWRLTDGSFEARGTRTYRSPSDEPHSNEFSVHLSPSFSVLGVKEYRKLLWRRDSGPLSCDFLKGKIACTSNARNAAQNVTLDLAMDNAYGFMWPISAFSLSGITRSASHDAKMMTPVDLVRVEETSSADPIMATILSGHLKYLGAEDLTLADHKWRADKFELKVPLHAPFLLWTSSEGLLLAFAPETKNKSLSGDGMVLVRFQQWLEF